MNSLAPILLRLGVTLEKKFNAMHQTERENKTPLWALLLHQKVHSCLYFSERVRYLFSSGRWAHHAHLKFSFSVAHTHSLPRERGSAANFVLFCQWRVAWRISQKSYQQQTLRLFATDISAFQHSLCRKHLNKWFLLLLCKATKIIKKCHVCANNFWKFWNNYVMHYFELCVPSSFYSQFYFGLRKCQLIWSVTFEIPFYPNIFLFFFLVIDHTKKNSQN